MLDCPDAYYWIDPHPYYDVYYVEPVYPVYYYAPVYEPIYYVPYYDYGYYYDDIIIFAKSRFEEKDVDLIEKGLQFAGHHYSKVSSNPRVEVDGLFDPETTAEEIVFELVNRTLEETEATDQMVYAFFSNQ